MPVSSSRSSFSLTCALLFSKNLMRRVEVSKSSSTMWPESMGEGAEEFILDSWDVGKYGD